VARAIDALTLWARLAAADAQAQMQYRFSFVADVVATSLGLLTEFAAILVLFTHVPQLGGWTVWEVALLYGTAEISLSTGRMVAAGFDRLVETVRLGEFDRYLIRPRNTFVQVLGSELNLRQLGRLAQGVAALALGLRALDVVWPVWNWLFLGWTIAGGVLFFTGLFVIGGALVFWTVDSLELMNVLTYGGSAMASYPMGIYARPLRDIFVFLIPLAFVNYYPFVALLGKADPIGLPPAVAFLAFPLCAAVFVVGYRFWHVGVRHYQGTGS
jgi:ABC-2 type transport system permease protein